MARRQGGTLSGFTPLSTPSAPTIDSVTTSIGSASVAFTAPTDVGDAAVSSYVVTAVNESTGASTGATGTSSPISISPGGGTFKIRMQALNAYGPGRLTEYDTGNVIYSGAELYAWGLNTLGQLGLSDIVTRSSPVQVGALTTWSQVSSGSGAYHTTAVKTDGTLWSFGYNRQGQLGVGNVVYRSSPTQVGALTTWYQVACGNNHTVSVKTDNTLWTWGSSQFGQLGDNTIISKSSPVQVGALTNWDQVKGANVNTVAIKTDGTMWVWGRNNYGQLADGTVVGSKSSPVQVGSLSNWSQVFSGEANFSAVKTDGTLWSWGRNNRGQLGDNTIANKSSPVQIGSLTGWSQVSGGSEHVAAIKTDGTLWTWGRNNGGQLGINTGDVGTNRSSPVQVGALTNWSQVSGGLEHTVAVKTDGTLWSWGLNTHGRLGDGTVTSRSSPVQIGVLTNWYQSGAGSTFTLALYGVV